MSSDDTLSDSPFRDMLGTNLIPSNNQVNQIKVFLEAPLDELAVVEHEVNNARRVLEALVAKQTMLSRRIEAHQALIHPMRRLPKELLQEVFLHCLPSEHLPVMSASEAPILLTHVCHPWRVLALATPALWSSIHIPVPRGKSEDEHLDATESRLTCVKWWLALTKDTRLTISLYWPNTLHYAFGTDHIFPKVVSNYSNQLRTLELDVPDDIFYIFAKMSHSTLPNLESVVLHLPVPPGHPTRGTRARTASWWRAPKLKRVVWESVDDEFLRLPLKWSQMEEIDIGASSMVPVSYFSSTDACGLVEACPNLVRLRLNLTVYPHSRLPLDWRRDDVLSEGTLNPSSADSDGTTNAVLPHKSPIVLQYLTTLDLTDVYLDPDSHMFLEHLQLPALTTLSYKLIPFPIPTSDQHPLVRFLRAQVHHPIGITRWKVETTSMTSVVFLECLKLMPLLNLLHVEDTRSLGYNLESTYVNDICPSDHHLQELLPISIRRREEWGYQEIGKHNEQESDEEEAEGTDAGLVRLDETAMEVEDSDNSRNLEAPPLEPLEQEQAIADLTPETSTSSPPGAEVDPDARTPRARISVAIPVDTSDLIAEESECLCPHLETLRVDRASFTSKGLKTFVKARLELAGAIQRQHSFHDSSGPSSPSFVSAPSSPILALPSSPTVHHRPLWSGSGQGGGVVPLQSIHIGLVYPRPQAPPRDDGERDQGAESEEDLENELTKMGVVAKILYRESIVTPSRRGGVRNDAREGVRRVVGWR